MIDLAVRRFADGDHPGAMTSICGAVDQLTADIYARFRLGDQTSDSYQDRVSRSFRALEPQYRERLDGQGLDRDEITRLWSNHRSAVNGAAYVLGSYRRRFSDVYGGEQAAEPFVQNALDCAVFALRSLAALL